MRHQSPPGLAWIKILGNWCLARSGWPRKVPTSPMRVGWVMGWHALIMLTCPITLRPKRNLLPSKVLIQWLVGRHTLGQSDQACWLGGFASLTRHDDLGHPTSMLNYLIVLGPRGSSLPIMVPVRLMVRGYAVRLLGQAYWSGPCIFWPM